MVILFVVVVVVEQTGVTLVRVMVPGAAIVFCLKQEICTSQWTGYFFTILTMVSGPENS